MVQGLSSPEPRGSRAPLEAATTSMSPGQMDSQSSDIKSGRRLRASGVALVNWTLMSGFKLPCTLR